MRWIGVLVLFLLLVPSTSWAGLYYSGETFNDLPCSWRGFLLDHRLLRMIAVPPTATSQPSLFREQYQDQVQKLEKQAKERQLTAEELADLGALYVRLGQPSKAVELLRPAQRNHPKHFRIAANLGSAWQQQGDIKEAVQALQESVRLAPDRWKKLEEFHLKWLRLRSQDGKEITSYDDLFGLLVEPENKAKIPKDAVAVVQQLALWFPADGRLLWLLGELAHMHGDVRTAANILDGCVTEFAMSAKLLRQHRQAYRTKADEIAKLPDSEHDKYRGDLKTKSNRALLRKLDFSRLPTIRAEGVNTLPWFVVSETMVERPFKPRFTSYLEELDQKQITITGFMQPINEEVETTGFLLIEFPIGCWFCETPEPTGILYVQLPKDKTTFVKRGLLKITGKLRLNRNDPEDFLYTIEDAVITDPD